MCCDPAAKAARRQARLDRKLARWESRSDWRAAKAERRQAKFDRKVVKLDEKLAARGYDLNLSAAFAAAAAAAAAQPKPTVSTGREMVVASSSASPLGADYHGRGRRGCGSCGQGTGRGCGTRGFGGAPRGPIGLLATTLASLAIAGKKRYDERQAMRRSLSSSSDSSDSEEERGQARRTVNIPIRDTTDLPPYRDEKAGLRIADKGRRGRTRVLSNASSVISTPSATASRASSVGVQALRNRTVEEREREEQEALEREAPPPTYFESVSGRVRA